jgi:transposase-like protein
MGSDVADMVSQRGISVTYDAVREWERKLAPLLSEALRKRCADMVGAWSGLIVGRVPSDRSPV